MQAHKIKNRQFMIQLGFLAGIMVVYYVVLYISRLEISWIPDIAPVVWPSLWLIASTLVLNRFLKFPLIKLSGGKPVDWVTVLACLSILIPLHVLRYEDLEVPHKILTISEGIYLICIIPIAEEVFMRGALLSVLRRKLPDIAAVIVVSLVFGLMHIQLGIGFAAVITVISAIWGFAVVRTGSIVWAIALHMAYNSFVVTSTYGSEFGKIFAAVLSLVMITFFVIQGLSINDNRQPVARIL